jgi:hypothetical protein
MSTPRTLTSFPGETEEGSEIIICNREVVDCDNCEAFLFYEYDNIPYSSVFPVSLIMKNPDDFEIWHFKEKYLHVQDKDFQSCYSMSYVRPCYFPQFKDMFEKLFPVSKPLLNIGLRFN